MLDYYNALRSSVQEVLVDLPLDIDNGSFTFQSYRTLMRVFPDAKVLLTVRDAERWYESVKGSIYTANNYNQGTVGLFLKLVGQFRRMNIVLSTSNQGPPVNEKGKHVLIFFRVRI